MTKGQLTSQLITDDGAVLPVYTGFGQSFNTSIDALKAMHFVRQQDYL